MDLCKKCAWSRIGQKLPYCIDLRSKGATDCSKFYSAKALGWTGPADLEGLADDESPTYELEEPKEIQCALCGRMKDKGVVCWWCGSE
ncbi:hypothetical protein LCGC14_1167410 [marine sediment metagenome]|uniref:Uncharacterized protein n=1 Tax=marine sediment metagenome TaxID=412755 RepID=A0A0F9P8W8_9ZZZZ